LKNRTIIKLIFFKAFITRTLFLSFKGNRTIEIYLARTEKNLFHLEGGGVGYMKGGFGGKLNRQASQKNLSLDLQGQKDQ
jgi:hypothetical protein